MPTGGAATSGSTIAVGHEHEAVEVDDFRQKVRQALLRRLPDAQASARAAAEGDITAIMSQYVLDQSIDMCKNMC
jgi:hypothetical protein